MTGATVTVKLNPTEWRIVTSALERYERFLEESFENAHENDMQGMKAEFLRVKDLRERLR